MLRASSRQHQAGFTLIELLVVITIIGILIGLLLPSVNRVRETGRMTTCKSNLRQVAMGIINYETSHRVFPPGGYTEGACCSSKSNATWAILILPQIEQEPLWMKYRFDLTNGAPENAIVREAIIDLYNCPSDPDVEEMSVPESGPEGGWGDKRQYRHASYRAVSGISNGKGWFDTNQWESLDGNTAKMLAMRGIMHSVGYYSDKHKMRLNPEPAASIRDGFSTTLLLGEQATTTHKNRRTYWAYTYGSYNQSSVVPESRVLLGDYDRCVKVGGAGGDNACKRGWGSYHPEMIHYALADGHIAAMSQNVDIQLLANMATCEGQEAQVLNGE